MEGDRVLQDHGQIQNAIVSHFQGLFSTSSTSVDNGLVDSIIPRMVTAFPLKK